MFWGKIAWIELFLIWNEKNSQEHCLVSIYTPCKRSSLLLAEPEASFTRAFALSNTAQAQ